MQWFEYLIIIFSILFVCGVIFFSLRSKMKKKSCGSCGGNCSSCGLSCSKLIDSYHKEYGQK
ncbi:MAG: FeoB-associated Cys-rich membrane protein [Bacilli bacterium]|nr:FeoB-associated Cys-rich membrane protein [Bacilli bacterium]